MTFLAVNKERRQQKENDRNQIFDQDKELSRHKQ